MLTRKRIIITIILLLAFALLISPAINGMLFKHRYLDLISLVNEDKMAVKVELLEYKQGWLNSTAKVRVTLLGNGFLFLQKMNNANLSNPVRVIIDEKISHGPVIYNSIKKQFALGYAHIESVIHLPQQLETKMLANLNSNGIIQLGMLAKLNGDWQGTIRIPTLTVSLANLGEVNWNGLIGDFQIILLNKELKKLILDTTTGSVEIKSTMPNAQLKEITIQPSHSSYEINHQKSGMWAINNTVNIDGLAILLTDNSKYEFTKINFTNIMSSTEGMLINTNLSVNVDKLQTPDKIFSTLSAMHIGFSISNFDTSSVSVYFNNLLTNTESLQDADEEKIEQVLSNMMTPYSNFTGSINSQTPYGIVDMSVTTNWQPNAPIPNTFQEVLQHVNVQINLKAYTALVSKLIELYGNQFDPTLSTHVNQMKTLIAANQAKIPIANTTTPTPATPSPGSSTTSTTTLTTAKVISPQEFIADLLFIGYITKNADTYETVFTYDGKEWKMNNKSIN